MTRACCYRLSLRLQHASTLRSDRHYAWAFAADQILSETVGTRADPGFVPPSAATCPVEVAVPYPNRDRRTGSGRSGRFGHLDGPKVSLGIR